MKWYFTSKKIYLHFKWYFNYYVYHWSPPDKLLLLSEEASLAKNIYLHINLQSSWWVFEISENDPEQGCVPDCLHSEDSISCVSLALSHTHMSGTEPFRLQQLDQNQIKDQRVAHMSGCKFFVGSLKAKVHYFFPSDLFKSILVLKLLCTSKTVKTLGSRNKLGRDLDWKHYCDR